MKEGKYKACHIRAFGERKKEEQKEKTDIDNKGPKILKKKISMLKLNPQNGNSLNYGIINLNSEKATELPTMPHPS